MFYVFYYTFSLISFELWYFGIQVLKVNQRTFTKYIQYITRLKTYKLTKKYVNLMKINLFELRSWKNYNKMANGPIAERNQGICY